ncbi:MAG: M23 family metallopeptidase [Actinomycetota bacterium]
MERRRHTAARRIAFAGVLLSAVVASLLAAVPAQMSALAQPAPDPTPSLPPLFPTPTPSPTPSKSPSPEATPTPDEEEEREKRNERKERVDRKNKEKRSNRLRKGAPYFGTFHPSGAYSTETLVAIEASLHSFGFGEVDVLRKVYPPFVVTGDAAWANTWGAPRYGPGPIVRRHEGQDIFCRMGAPVLAAEPGIVEFDVGGLGGRVARLYRADGSYWYYAHLSDWNLGDFASGDSVRRGDIIGYCGNTGNARTTPPHLHFGWYTAGGRALNPHRILVTWLRAAEKRALHTFERIQALRVENSDRLTARRRFGDYLAPDLSELTLPGESLWASGSSPTGGVLVLAEAALAAALGNADFEQGFTGDVRVSSMGAGLGVDPTSKLGRLLFDLADSTSESGD